MRWSAVCQALWGTGTPGAGVVPDAVELAALRALYTSTNSANWREHSKWLTGTTLAEAATWSGVTVRDGDVQTLALNANRPRASLPAELGQLTQLQGLHLNLHYNQFRGSVSTKWGPLLSR